MIKYILLFVCGLSGFARCDESKLCQKCDEPAATSHVRGSCEGHNSTGDLLMSDCCCVNTTSEIPRILGLDWSNCQLTSISGLLTSQPALRILMLDNNTDLTTNKEDFQGLTQLIYLSLPGIMCPGGNDSWNATIWTDNSVICQDELDVCVTNNLTCPNNNSHCVLSAPGEAECLCNQGFHGYKCLRQGHFPSVYYAAVLCSAAVVTAVFMWCTQRRKVKKLHVH